MWGRRFSGVTFLSSLARWRAHLWEILGDHCAGREHCKCKGLEVGMSLALNKGHCGWSSEADVEGVGGREDGRDQPEHDLLGHGKEFRFYSPWASEPLEGFD